MEQFEGVVELFQRLVPTRFLESVEDLDKRRGIFSTALVAWLFMYQRLQEGSSMSDAMVSVASGEWQKLSRQSKRVREQKVSERTGGYSQARSSFSVEAAEKISDRVFHKLCAESAISKWKRPVFAIDGSTIELSSASEIIKTYPPARNQNGTCKNGILHFLIAHELESGYAVRPSYGAFFGENLCTEAELCREVLPRLPKNAVLVGDRNFGIFVTAYAIVSSNRDIVVRLTEGRAKKITQVAISPGEDLIATWTPSSDERKKYPHLPPNAQITGRVICETVKTREGKQIQLHLFTTLDLASAQIIELYGLRWNIETDLRTLKRTVNLKSLAGKTPDMIAKELLMGIAAYNLVRALMALAAGMTGHRARQMSFSQTLSIVRAIMPRMAVAVTDYDRQQLLDKMLHLATRATLPNRKRKKPPLLEEKTK